MLATAGLLAGVGCAGVKSAQSPSGGGRKLIFHWRVERERRIERERRVDHPDRLQRRSAPTSSRRPATQTRSFRRGSPPRRRDVREPVRERPLRDRARGRLAVPEQLASPPRARHVPGSSNPYSGYLKITFHADMESTDLVVYAQGDNWPLPKSIWQNLAAHIVGTPIKVTVQNAREAARPASLPGRARGCRRQHGVLVGQSDGGRQGPRASGFTTYSEIESSTIRISTGSRWVTSRPSHSRTAGQSCRSPTCKQPTLIDEKDSTTQAGTNGATHTPPRCIGCHVGTPDGDYVAFVDFWPWSVAFADVARTTAHGRLHAAGVQRHHLHRLEQLHAELPHGSICPTERPISRSRGADRWRSPRPTGISRVASVSLS